MDSPVISVIVPIYKAEKTLSKCLDSILFQSYNSWECILVDDGSPDKSGIICDEYVVRDSRFKVIHKQNGGVSSARNLGIEAASGEWIMFVDSDDWLDNSTFDEIRKKEFDSDLLILNYRRIYNYDNLNQEYYFKELFLNGDTYKKELCHYIHKEIMLSPWAKIFRSSIIKQNHIRFDENITWAEDRLFNLTFLQYTKNIRFVNCGWYNYVCPQQSSNGVKKYNLNHNMLGDLFCKMRLVINNINCDRLASSYLCLWIYSEKIDLMSEDDTEKCRRTFYKNISFKEILKYRISIMPFVVVCKYAPRFISKPLMLWYLK